jgi:hypothetical protein
MPCTVVIEPGNSGVSLVVAFSWLPCRRVAPSPVDRSRRGLALGASACESTKRRQRHAVDQKRMPTIDRQVEYPGHADSMLLDPWSRR